MEVRNENEQIRHCDGNNYYIRITCVSGVCFRGDVMKPSPTARERRLLALAKYFKAKAQEAERKELELRKAVERQAKSILSVIHS